MGEAIEMAFEFFKNRPCLGYRRKTSEAPSFEMKYTWLTYKQFQDLCIDFGKGLATYLGIQKRSFIGISSINRIEWFVSDFGASMNGMTIVPIHHYLDENSIEDIIKNAKLEVVVCSQDLVSKYLNVKERCPSLKHIIQLPDQTDGSFERHLDGIDLKMKSKEQKEKISFVVSFNNILKEGSNSSFHNEIVRLEKEDIYTIIYTSGSTGTVPKGAVFTDLLMRLTVVSQLRTSNDPLVQISKDSLAHISVNHFFNVFTFLRIHFLLMKRTGKVSFPLFLKEEEQEFLQME